MRLFFALFVISGLSFLSGCPKVGQSTTTVSGTVTVKGKGPLTGGTIRFVSVSNPNQTGSANIEANGTYKATNVPVGECKIAIENDSLRVSSGGSAPPPGKNIEGYTPPPAAKGTYMSIDPKYRMVETSGLSHNTSSGSTKDIELNPGQ